MKSLAFYNNPISNTGHFEEINLIYSSIHTNFIMKGSASIKQSIPGPVHILWSGKEFKP